jgi:ribonucleoside-diphosphate reductase alpha subunit
MAPPATDVVIESESSIISKMNEINDHKEIKGSIEKILDKHIQDLPEINVNDVDFKKLQKYLDDGLNTEFEVIKELSIMCRDKTITHPNWGLLAGRIQMYLLHKKTPLTFSECTLLLKEVLNKDYFDFVMANAKELNEMIKPERDFNFNTFSTTTLEKSYLVNKRENGKMIYAETPQYMFLRVATFIHYSHSSDKSNVDDSLKMIKETYDAASEGYISFASPTLFNAGMKRHQLASCFLISVGDNMQSISKSWNDSAIISMNTGAVGLNYSGLRHSKIGTHGESKGIIPWLKIENEILCGVDQGGRRKGAGTIFLSDWHIDIEEFIDAKKPTGNESLRARDLFYALWTSDLFMERVENDEMWSLFCPNEAQGLEDVYGLEFKNLYRKYESEKRYRRQLNARLIWIKVCISQIEVGMPFICYKDNINRKNNQGLTPSLGTIKCSNLCVEINQFTSDKEIASCNLMSIPLNRYIDYEPLTGIEESNAQMKPFFNFKKYIKYIRKYAVRSLNNIIDRNYYPSEIPQIEYANKKNRPIGIGSQGKANVFALMKYAWTSQEARILNKQMYEAKYYACLKESMCMAKVHGPYESFPGSPFSRGLLQFDLWDLERFEKTMQNNGSNPINYRTITYDEFDKLVPLEFRTKHELFSNEKWHKLRMDIMENGLYNSELTAEMPTASSSNVLGNNECFEPFSELIYARSTLSGQFIITSKELVEEMELLGMWNTENIKNIIKNRGSIQNLEAYNPNDQAKLDDLKTRYLTSFELKQRVLVDMDADMGLYCDQACSSNRSMKDPTYKKLTSMHFYSWKRGIKTAMYYLHTSPATDPVNIAAEYINVPDNKVFIKNGKKIVCKAEVCTVCSG